MKTPLPFVLPCILIVTLTSSALVAQEVQEEGPSPGEALFQQAREYYGDRQYGDSARSLVQAVQADPTDPRYYRGLARSLHYDEQYELSVYYYDLYLEHFSEHAAAERSRSNRTEAIQRERDRANNGRENQEIAPTLPETQSAALGALEQRLVTGPFMALDHSGALTMLLTVHRTGYAHPHLSELHAAVRDGITAETDRLFAPSADSPVPVATYDQWRFVHERYRAVESLGGSTSADPLVQARLLTAQAQIDLINANYEAAAGRFSEAATLEPDLALNYWGLLRAHHGSAVNSGQPISPLAHGWVTRLEELVSIQSPQHMPVLAIANSMVYADLGQFDQAAASLISLLSSSRARLTLTPLPTPTTASPIIPDVQTPEPIPTTMPSDEPPPPIPGPTPVFQGEPPPPDL